MNFWELTLYVSVIMGVPLWYNLGPYYVYYYRDLIQYMARRKRRSKGHWIVQPIAIVFVTFATKQRKINE